MIQQSVLFYLVGETLSSFLRTTTLFCDLSFCQLILDDPCLTGIVCTRVASRVLRPLYLSPQYKCLSQSRSIHQRRANFPTQYVDEACHLPKCKPSPSRLAPKYQSEFLITMSKSGHSLAKGDARCFFRTVRTLGGNSEKPTSPKKETLWSQKPHSSATHSRSVLNFVDPGAAWCLALYSIHLYPLLIIHKLQDKQDIILKLDTHYARRTPRGRRKHSCN